ncbi:hypothetical protein [Halovivax gelatinilyticus]|uniref:hypothetical protein n=1 Tax=Halovivax gelatinilyticus TaxID=2961597 RepID=UPI0020CA2C14|nr:hypothetical protein [Halovivax gelatinilyticus]
MSESNRIQWHRDADTSRTIRVSWALGVGTLLGALALIIFGRLFGLTAQTGGQSVVVAALFAVAATIVALAIAGDPERRLAAMSAYLPGDSYPAGGATADASTREDTAGADAKRLKRGIDAAVGAVVMASVIFALDALVGGNVGEMLAAATIPFALVLVLLAVFLRSTGVYDRESAVIYLFDPPEEIDLGEIESVSVRYVGNTAFARLRYGTRDGEYIPGPRRLVLPPGVARDMEATI